MCGIKIFKIEISRTLFLSICFQYLSYRIFWFTVNKSFLICQYPLCLYINKQLFVFFYINRSSFFFHNILSYTDSLFYLIVTVICFYSIVPCVAITSSV